MKNNTVVALLENIYWHTPTAELTDIIRLTTHPGLHKNGELKWNWFSFLPLCDIFEDTGNLVELHVAGEAKTGENSKVLDTEWAQAAGVRARVFLTQVVDMICEQKWKCESYNHITVW